MDHEVKIGNGRETKVITLRHPPRVGQVMTVGGEAWEVLSVSYEIPYRIPSMSFTVKEEAS